VSFLHPEETRRCKLCGHTWRAEKWTKLDRGAPVIGGGFTASQQHASRQATADRREGLHERWARCAKCGSRKVKTIEGASAAMLSDDPRATAPSPPQAPSSTRTALPPPLPPVVALTQTNAGAQLNELERLARLLEQGHISRDEFNVLKARLLG